MKKTMAFVLIFLLVLSIFNVVYSSLGNKTITVTYRNISIYVNGQKVTPEVESFIYNSRTVVPLRFISEALNKEVKWDSVNNRIDINDKSQTQTFKIGDRVKLGDCYMTVNGVQDVAPTEFWQPKEGNKFFAVNVTLENLGSDPKFYEYGENHFMLRNSEGYLYDGAKGYKSPRLLGGLLQQGEKIRGWMTFEIHKTASGLELIYQPPPPWQDVGQIIIKLE